MSKIYEEICNQEGRRISARTIGLKQIVIDDFNEIRCPICGDKMEISGISTDGESNNTKYIASSSSHIDSNNIRHTYFYGRDEYTQTSKIYMRCPSLCVEQMTINVEDIAIGEYRELNELQQHEIAKL